MTELQRIVDFPALSERLLPYLQMNSTADVDASQHPSFRLSWRSNDCMIKNVKMKRYAISSAGSFYVQGLDYDALFLE